jgi:hypothetical protein
MNVYIKNKLGSMVETLAQHAGFYSPAPQRITNLEATN